MKQSGLAFSLKHAYSIGMTKTQALDFFGTAAICARTLRISEAAVSMWPERLPALRQFQIALASGGELHVDPEYLPVMPVAAREAA